MSIEFAYFGGNRSYNVDACLYHAPAEGAASKLVFGDENSELDPWLDSSSSRTWEFSFLKGLPKSCVFLLLVVFNIELVVDLKVLSRDLWPQICLLLYVSELCN